MEALTVQAFIKGVWVDVGTISFPKSHQHNFRVTELHYLSDYALAHHDQDDCHAVSINHPVSFFFDDMGKPGWLRFLDDIMPSGASDGIGLNTWILKTLASMNKIIFYLNLVPCRQLAI